ncbi:CRTAC1 family protein [Lacihabitans sp. LS3-19]|uniref:VCBS repeat-containing protein n=1 Tax=Lacihabitans sp. LS3-19 TaxID=2487335 RepID=UPI0020CC953B|nr:VCBS repeat-containing protein [Lacihabitans sp. LS3-19]MCP9766678.1 CRTAC1 family protein [Lacihabitans sp. LS3-19]
MKKILSGICISAFSLFFSCQKNANNGIFELIPSSVSGIDFENTVKNSENFNIFNYRNFYNGAGVAIGDINNDGLADVLLTSNMGSNKLFLNKGLDTEGNPTFEDISKKAGIEQTGKWNTGVVMVDINHDGWLDIYICNAGIDKWKKQDGNALFINNKNLSFTDKAVEYGLDDKGYSTHAAFFDFDLDGDLDCYVLNNSFIPVNTLNYDNNRDLRAEDWPVKDFLKGGGDKLYKNNGGHFEDISKEAGIYGSLIGFGLGVTVGDVNNDNYPDIYISNDFFEKDYLYINQKNGTFSEELEKRINHTSLASMGADMADINNDGLQEIYVTDMLPKEEERLKTTTSFDNHYVYKLKYEKGFYNQYMQNSLQLNNGDGSYSEIANYSGVAASDWSWGALMFDADNDSRNDIYVSNGIFHDVIDQDFIDFFANDINQKMVMSGQKEKFDNIIKHMPSRRIVNNFFHNDGNLQFSEMSKEFGFSEPSFSNGAAYGDLDNDGDLDLVVNNVNQQCFVYKNKSNEQPEKNNYVKVKLKGQGENTFAIGSKILVYTNDGILTKQIHPSKGFQSSTEYAQTIGIGKSRIDSLVIFWPNNTKSIYKNIETNKLLKYDITEGVKIENDIKNIKETQLFEKVNFSIFEKHTENDYEDFYNEKNIPIILSKEGPKAAIGDINGDGKQDVFICGAKNQAGQLYIQTNGGFTNLKNEDLKNAAFFEDTAAEFFDADGDGDLDLVVGTGGNDTESSERMYLNRLYLNDGKGNFKYNNQALPYNGFNTSCIAPFDFDSDGDLDLFIGNRSTPMAYGLNPQQYILQNDGKGNFKNITKEVCPELANLGMVRSVAWADINGDKKKELVIVGDWMSPKVYEFKNKKFETINSGLENLSGFWGEIKAADLDNDGDLDLVLGNIGENFALKASEGNPLKLWVADFDENNQIDKILTKRVNGKDVPVFLKREMMEQFPILKAKSLKHEDYAKKSIEDLFDNKKIMNAQKSEVNTLKSIIALNNGKGHFTITVLPFQAQLSCINAVNITDINHDGQPDILLAGNFTGYIPQFTRLDACRGITMMNQGKGKFEVIKNIKSGFTTSGEVKDLKFITVGNKKLLISLSNNSVPQFFELKNQIQ